MQIAPDLRHRARILGDALLLPAVGDRTQQRDQRRRRGDEHALARALLQQRRVGLERRVREVLARQEQEDEVGRRLELVPVGLGRQTPDVLAQQARVRGERRGAGRLVVRLVGVEERMQRRLRVDDHLLAAGQPDDQVRTQQATVVGRDRRLLDEVAVRRHAGQLDDASELQLAPAPARVRLAQRRDERAGARVEPLLPGRERAQLLVERAAGVGAPALDLPSFASIRASASWIGSCSGSTGRRRAASSAIAPPNARPIRRARRVTQRGSRHPRTPCKRAWRALARILRRARPCPAGARGRAVPPR